MLERSLLSVPLLGDLSSLLILPCLDELRDDRGDECRDCPLDLLLALLFKLRLLRELGLGVLLGVAVPGLGVRLLFEPGEGLLLRITLVFLLALELDDLLE